MAPWMAASGCGPCSRVTSAVDAEFGAGVAGALRARGARDHRCCMLCAAVRFVGRLLRPLGSAPCDACSGCSCWQLARSLRLPCISSGTCTLPAVSSALGAAASRDDRAPRLSRGGSMAACGRRPSARARRPCRLGQLLVIPLAPATPYSLRSGALGTCGWAMGCSCRPPVPRGVIRNNPEDRNRVP